jgi:hypothetical protein
VVPHFDVTTIDGRRTAYKTIWQRGNLVLAVLPANDPAAAEYAGMLSLHASDIASHAAECVITHESVGSLTAPALLIADRWGDIAIEVAARAISELPPLAEILAWLEHVQHRCPECEGEAR